MNTAIAFLRKMLRSRRLWVIFGLLVVLGSIGYVLTETEESKIPGITSPIWRGIVPGKTKQWDVIAIMGKPDAIRKCNLEEYTPGMSEFPNRLLGCFSPILTYEYKEVRPPRKLPATHEIRFRFATVWAIVEDVWLSSNEPNPELLKRFVAEYGLPEKVTWSLRSPPMGLRAFLFCEHGLMVHANDTYVSEIFYFVPVKLNECLEEFKDDVTTTDPSSPGSDIIIGPENPWPWLIDGK